MSVAWPTGVQLLVFCSPVETYESNGNTCVQSPGESSNQLGMPFQSRPILNKSDNTIQNSKETEVNSHRQHLLDRDHRRDNM